MQFNFNEVHRSALLKLFSFVSQHHAQLGNKDISKRFASLAKKFQGDARVTHLSPQEAGLMTMVLDTAIQKDPNDPPAQITLALGDALRVLSEKLVSEAIKDSSKAPVPKEEPTTQSESKGETDATTE